MSYTQLLYHLVWSTKHRAPALSADRRDEFYSVMAGALRSQKCYVYRIGGVADHVHILTTIHPTFDVSEIIRSVKTATHAWIDDNRVFPQFNGWQEGYGAFTFAYKDLSGLSDYVCTQEQHHSGVSSLDEFRALLAEAGLQWDEKYLK